MSDTPDKPARAREAKPRKSGSDAQGPRASQTVVEGARATQTSVESPSDSGQRETTGVNFGQAAIKLGLVTPAQIHEAMSVSRSYAEAGRKPPLIGQILVDLGYLKQAQVLKIKEQQRVISLADRIPGYKIVNKIGAGAMGIVYRARQLRLERWVAIKILQPELSANPEWRERFIREARNAARLNHPNIITGIDAGEVDGQCYFAMEYVDGHTLEHVIGERGPMEERMALSIVRQVAGALDHASYHDMIHRDIKPDNIMVNKEKVAKVLDLGLARLTLQDGDGNGTRGLAVGTPNYISPEQAMGREDVDARTDIYSLGVTLFKMLTARTPFSGPPEVVMYRQVHEPPPDPRTFRPNLAAPICELCLWMMNKLPGDRPESHGVLIEALDEVLHMITGSSQPALAPAPKTRSAPRLPTLQRPTPTTRVVQHPRQTPRPTAYQAGPPAAGPARRPTGGIPLVPNGAPPQQAHQQTPAPQPAQEPVDDGIRMPRRRRRNFGASW